MTVSVRRDLRLAMLLTSLGVASANADMIFSSPTQTVESARRIELTLTVTNPGAKPLHVDLPDPVHVKLDTDAAGVVLDMSADEPLKAFDLAPGSFRSFKLHGDLPQIPAGLMSVAPTGIEANALVLRVTEPTSPEAAPATTAGQPSLVQENPTSSPTPGMPDDSKPAPDAPALVDKPPRLALSVYEPVYFIFGGDGGFNAKFQISFKYQLFDAQGNFSKKLPWLGDLYLGYSQTSLWDLGELSAPFKDTSYRPRLFYLNDHIFDFFDGRLRVGVESGVGHESNGKDKDQSRSVNLAYLRPIMTWGDPEGQHLYLGPMVYSYLDRSDNADIANYRGHVDFLAGYGSKGGLNFWTTLRKGEKSDFGSAELNLSYPLSRITHGVLSGWAMLQYFTGYGESLIDYNHRLDSQWRLGLAIAL
jgi:phospholipase A1